VTTRFTGLALLLVAGALALSNFAALIAIGLSGADARLRIKVALVFGLFEAGMPVLGLLLGRLTANAVGSHANLLAGGLLVATGVFTIAASRHANAGGVPSIREHDWSGCSSVQMGAVVRRI
jgi:manganese efflux pump family protein